MEKTVTRRMILSVAETVGMTSKKVLEVLFLLRHGQAVENNELVKRTGVSRNVLNLLKKEWSELLLPGTDKTQMKPEVVGELDLLFGEGWQPDDSLWRVLDGELGRRMMNLLDKYAHLRPEPNRAYDQFYATKETVAKRAELLNFMDDVAGKRLLFLGDDDWGSVGVGLQKQAEKVVALDVDKRMLGSIRQLAELEKLEIETEMYDARDPLFNKWAGNLMWCLRIRHTPHREWSYSCPEPCLVWTCPNRQQEYTCALVTVIGPKNGFCQFTNYL